MSPSTMCCSAHSLTSRTPSGSGALAMAYDNAGNLVSQETAGDTVTYIYDAWNRLVEIKYGSDTRSEHRYNGLNWRILKRADTSTPPNGELNQQRIMYYYYNANWQLLEEFINDAWDDEAADDEHDRRMQYAWGARYIDDIALRRQFEEEDIMGPGTITHSWYHLTDTLFSTIAIIDDAANLIERASYDAYGNARHHRMADLDGDGATTSADFDLIRGSSFGDYGVGDLNRDGIVDSDDTTLLNNDMVVGNALPAGRISLTDNIIGYAGYVFNAEMHGSGLYTVRHRHYSPELGRWTTRDPLGYVDGMSLYEYVQGNSVNAFDPFGLSCWWKPSTWVKAADDRHKLPQPPPVEAPMGPTPGLFIPAPPGVTPRSGDGLNVVRYMYGPGYYSDGTTWDDIKLASIGIAIFTTKEAALSLAPAGSIVRVGKYFYRVVRKGGKNVLEVLHRHHLLPRQFEPYFRRNGIQNIDDHIILLDPSRHIRKPDGVHTGPDNWNKVWDDWIKKNPDASPDQTLKKMNDMINDFGL